MEFENRGNENREIQNKKSVDEKGGNREKCK